MALFFLLACFVSTTGGRLLKHEILILMGINLVLSKSKSRPRFVFGAVAIIVQSKIENIES